MPEIENSIRPESTAQPAATRPAGASVRETRFDPAHEVARDEGKFPMPLSQPSADNPAAHPASATVETSETSEVRAAFFDASGTDTGGISPEVVQQFRLQAQQLAAHLDIRQRDLDRREAELHARIAQHEGAARSARLWFQERNNELLERQTQIDDREQQLASRLVEIDERLETETTSAEESQDQRQELINRLSAEQDQLVLRDLDLQRRQDELNEFALQLNQREEQCQVHEQKLGQREQRLEAAETALARSQVEWDDQRKQEQQERADIHSRLEQQQARMIDQHRHAEIELQKQRDVLASRSDHLERRSAAFDQLRNDLLRLHCETLEMRLATEELWAQMSGLVPPAAITQSLARLRVQLAENFRLQAAEAAEQRSGVEELATKVAQQHQRLAAQKSDWQQWAAAQQRQIETQAAQLVAREEGLQHEVERLHQARQEWDAQRHALECEIRRLQTELRHRDAESPLSV